MVSRGILGKRKPTLGYSMGLVVDIRDSMPVMWVY